MADLQNILLVQQAPRKMAGRIGLTCLLMVVLLGAGCSSRSLTHAPVEDRGTGLLLPAAVAVDGGVKQLPGYENAGKPGYYTVKPGDTLIRISLDSGQNRRDIVRWNNLDNPNLIEVGQVLRVVPPSGDNPLVVTRPVSSGSATTTTGTAAPASTATAPRPAATAASSSPAPALASSSPVPPSAAASSSPAPAGEDEIAWIWPTQGSVLTGFDEVKNKGFDISGKAGDPIVAAADGRVVYAGAGLRGYGNLIILKHNNTFLTAYAHNQTLLVKEDQSVKKGQKIAEMGSSDADRVKLHFEIRRQGKPVDPAKYLPPK